MRVGIFGGTFDPPHVGHLIAAADAADAIGLDRVAFVPAATQPLKRDVPSAPAPDRLAMVRLLVDDDPRLTVETIEIDRAGLSFTVETLAELARRSPGDALFFLMGADVVRSFSRWRDPGAVMRMAELVILRRGDMQVAEIEACMPRDPERPGRGYRVLTTRRVDVSSTDVRARVRDGKSIHGFVPDAVRDYIERAGLYRGGADPQGPG